jgi:hypothetical protein
MSLFTWPGPSWVLGCTGQRPGGPGTLGSAAKTQGHGCHAVPLNSAESPAVRTSAEDKDYDSGFGRLALCHTRIRLPQIALSDGCSRLDFAYSMHSMQTLYEPGITTSTTFLCHRAESLGALVEHPCHSNNNGDLFDLSHE